MTTLKQIVADIQSGSLSPESAVPMIKNLKDEYVPGTDSVSHSWAAINQHMVDGDSTDWHPNSGMYLPVLRYSDRVTPEQYELLEAALKVRKERDARNAYRLNLRRSRQALGGDDPG